MRTKSLFVTFVAIFSLLIWGLSDSSDAAIFTVTNTLDSGAGSLRQALVDANASAGADTIIFNIPTTDANYNATLGIWTISPASELPSLTDDSTFVDGMSQADFMGYDTNPNGPEIEISGLNAGSASGLTILSAYNVIQTLVINNFQKFGIYIEYSGAHHNVIKGCYVGTDVTGTQDFGNGFSGIIIYNYAKHNVIGGTLPGEGNVASGNGWAGIEIQATGADSNLVIGNKVGTDATGTSKIGNNWHGVYVWSYAAANIIGGKLAAEKNIISGNGTSGISLLRANYTKVWGNYVGMNANGTEAIPNDGVGVYVFGSYNIIGGNEPGEGNLISSNDVGIEIAVDSMNIVAGNNIGTDVTGALPFPNLFGGILLSGEAHNNQIGPENLIKFNTNFGIQVSGESTYRNTITQNAISQNNGAGIDNTLGGNMELTPPTITAASYTEVSGTAPPNSVVEIFSDSEDEGEIYEGSTTCDGSGNFYWAGDLTGPNVTATATDQDGNTSEFSQPFSIVTSYTVSGFTRYYSNDEPIAGVNLSLDGKTTTTGEGGNFSFAEVDGGNYTLTPEKTGDADFAISAFDASLILQNVAEIIDLTPYQMIAADVTGNGTVTAFDASHILKYVVGLISEFPVGADWTFVPVNFEVTKANWFNAPDTISYSPLDSDKENQDFYGIVYGDVTGNWAAPLLGKQKSGLAKVQFGDIERYENDFVVPVQINGSAEIFSGFLKIKIEMEGLELKNISPGGTAQECAIAHNMQGDYLLIAFASSKPLNLNSDLLYLRFQAKDEQKSLTAEISEISFNQGEIAVELVNPELTLEKSLPVNFSLEQNYPNPFNASTKISFSLPQKSMVNLFIFDVSGREVRRLVNGVKASGNHSIEWNMEDERGNTVSTGVYFYKIDARALDGNSHYSKFRKMLVIK